MNKISIINPETVRNHVSNNSPSKIAHQFPKSRRFHEPSPYCPVAFYSGKGDLSNRRASIGYGKKSDFTKTMTITPGPDKYEHKSIFQNGKSRGISFAESRDRSPDRSYLIPQLHKNPGPGNYENQVPTRMTTSYTMRPRTLDVIQKHTSYKEAPGPGSYESVDLDPKSGRFTISKFGDSRLGKFANNPRFLKQKQTPGPLSYLQADGLSPRGKYVVSTRTGRGSRPFNHAARSSFTDEFAKNKRNPGPGDYDTPSEFGAYGDAKYYKTLNSFKSTIQ